MKISTRLVLSYGLIASLVIGTNIYYLDSINRLTDLTTQLYEHPYTVSTSLLRVKSGIIKIHRSMKDVVLAKDQESIDKARSEVDRYERQVYQDFDLITRQIVGNVDEVVRVRERFANWKPIREEVIQLMRSGRREEAIDINQGKAANHVANLQEDIQAIIDWADETANEFVVNAKITQKATLRNTFIVLMFFVGTVILLGWLITQSIVISLSQAIEINNKLAQGDLETKILVNNHDEIDQIMESVKRMVGIFRETVFHVKLVSRTVAIGSQTIRERSRNMASGAIEQATSTQQASISINHIVDHILNNTNHSSETLDMAIKAYEKAGESRRAMLDVVEVMKAIIDKIGVVQDIALQTNILALNSSIEATRSQKSAAGFTVVAAEVRRLATKTRSAAAEINQLAGSSMVTIAKAETMLDQLLPGIKNTRELVEKINSISQDQLKSSYEVNQAISELDEVTQRNSELAKELSTMSKDLADQSENLQKIIAFFKVS